MHFGKIRKPTGDVVVMIDAERQVHVIDTARIPEVASLSDLLAQPDPLAAARELIDQRYAPEPLGGQTFLAPVDRQEIWAAGVTYQRSKVAREEESRGAAVFYDRVYSAPRPELFFKATPARVVGPEQPVRIRSDSRWSVPEPELALVIGPDQRLLGYTIGNDMSARDIEGENPLYLPQAKIYRQSCAVGPWITPTALFPPPEQVEIRLTITRQGRTVFDGATSLARMARTPQELIRWLFQDNDFPHGAILLTGTGIVPPDDFTLHSGDHIRIAITGIGTLHNSVA
ncbi:fumarylacetoacetate hydrolase family protein [Thermogemmata fonticola]|uniref:Fumarylacetoacetate hydrolase family protein n=1 Tax=Thermogemmata fonticola TaxID=2755323 RepID=A0A7V8VGN5_9BACT|nr:fumarylacetoacetate hydrolase family protein [Thermogemmata fonticola]MBA2227591.1 fumarylacetoacetate hydrolase family protein [Thermogemmata fonticola]